MFGSHLSIAGALTNALAEGEKLGLDTVQIFTKNQQQWRCAPLDPAVVRDWRAGVARLGWDGRTVSHASYLINLASPDATLRAKSVDLMHEEIERCEALGIPFLVHHPGSPTCGDRDEGVRRIAEAYRELFGRTRGYRTVSCLENTVGGGNTLGRDFPELARLRAAVAEATGAPERVGFCVDTCHAHAAGCDLSTVDSANAALDQLAEHCGLENVRVLHLNDSKAKVGSRLDRHEHIGKGTIGLHGFLAVLCRPEFALVPKILETPKGKNAAGTSLDTLNLRRLKKLAEQARKADVSGAKVTAREAAGRGTRRSRRGLIEGAARGD